MIRTLLATTALAALLSSGAIAQDATPVDPAAPVTTEAPADPAAPAAADAMPVAAGGAMEETDINEPWDMATGYVATDTDNLASRLINQPVFSSSGDDAEEIGNITDLVFDENGHIQAVVIGVGGFLGIGEKAVAVDFQLLELTLAADNTKRWVLPTSADALNAAPDFVWEEDVPVDGAVDGGAMAPADPAMPPADPAAAPADPAAAPATN